MLNFRFLHSYVVESVFTFRSVLLGVSAFTLHFVRPSKRIFHIRNMMEVLKKETVHMKDRDLVEKKIHELISGGPTKLQVIADFDHTLSRVHKDGVKCATTYCILDQAPFLPEDYRYQSSCLHDYYHPIEIDPNLTRTEKTKYMVEWYTKSLDLMPTSGIGKGDVPKLVKSSNACLRDGCEAVFESLNKHNVPLLIFSAGIGDILKEVLRQNNVLFPNVHIIANFMHFDEKNKLAGFKDTLIHTFNKNQTSIANNDYFDTLKSRNNIILLGDTLGDIDMSEGAENINVILKIGFLNYRIEASLADYLNAYDIVLTDDQTMDVVNGLLQTILCPNQ